MKFKYFLRGLGIGIIFASIISITAFQSTDLNTISDKEVIERAKELGMVEKQESVQDALKKDSTTEHEKDKSTIQDITKEESQKEDKKTTEKKSKDDNTEKKTTEKKTTEKKTTEKQVTEKSTTETTTAKSTTQEVTTETTTQNNKQEKKTIQITIRGGMSSYPVCQMLEEAGLIKNAEEFDDYLIKNGYANRISVGTHSLTIGMSYEEIAIAISDPQ
ncbi:MAG: endolytic transglycosylase MltG [Lachnospiraceae bacterium]|nr:endolytic transglycosylase MltG [Lachnospiraceae bacterium]